MKTDIYQKVTDKVIADLEQGKLTWLNPWSAGNMDGHVLKPLRHSGLEYSGVNVLMLWLSLVPQIANASHPSPAGPSAASFDSQDRMIADATASEAYDNRGNMATLGGMSFTYDLSDQMLSASGTADGYGPISATYLYNGEGKRVQMTANGRNSFYVYDNAGRIVLSHKEHDGEGVEHLYLEAGPRLAKWTGTALTYLHVDHLGTTLRGTHGMGVQDAIDGTPAAVGDEIFHDFATPFGLSPRNNWYVALNSYSSAAQPTGPGSNCGVLGFTTHVKDCETGLQYMQARYYDPVLARFTTVDPVTFMDDGRTGMVNRFSYTLNDPLNAWDPDGHFPITFDPTAHSTVTKEEAQQRRGARSDFGRNYQDMRDADVIGADKFFHCKANCEATRRGPEGEAEAERLSDLREVIDQSPIPFIGGDPAEASEADQFANRFGRSGAKENPDQTCSQVCSDFIPNGLGEEYTGIPESEPEPEPNREDLE